MEAVLTKLRKEREEAYAQLLVQRDIMEDCGYCYTHKISPSPELVHHHDTHARGIRRWTETVKAYDVAIFALSEALDHVEV